MSPTIRALASQFLSRAATQKWRKDKANEQALEFFLGAYASLAAVEHPEAESILRFTTFLLVTRGTDELRRIVRTTETPQ